MLNAVMDSMLLGEDLCEVDRRNIVVHTARRCGLASLCQCGGVCVVSTSLEKILIPKNPPEIDEQRDENIKSTTTKAATRPCKGVGPWTSD